MKSSTRQIVTRGVYFSMVKQRPTGFSSIDVWIEVKSNLLLFVKRMKLVSINSMNQKFSRVKWQNP